MSNFHNVTEKSIKGWHFSLNSREERSLTTASTFISCFIALTFLRAILLILASEAVLRIAVITKALATVLVSSYRA